MSEKTKFKQIVTGIYSYKNKFGMQEFSHALYALDEEGNIFKYCVIEDKFITLSNSNINSSKKPEYYYKGDFKNKNFKWND